jgi:pre-mRNA-processing factor 39
MGSVLFLLQGASNLLLFTCWYSPDSQSRSLQALKIYERAVIATANYPEYWIRYVQFMESKGDLEESRRILKRATGTFVKRKPEIHIFAARFEEAQGNTEAALASFELLQKDIAPSLLEGIFKHANFLNRQGKPDEAVAVYEAAFTAEKAKDESRTLPFLALQYARFLFHSLGQVEKAREVYTAALEKVSTTKVLWEGAILLESLQAGDDRVARVQGLIGKALAAVTASGAPSLSATDREELSAYSVEVRLQELTGLSNRAGWRLVCDAQSL